MIGINLSTRPFYNLRAVRAALLLAALVVAAVTVLNVTRVLALRASEGALSARATEATEQANRLRADALRIRAQVDPREIEAISLAAADANDVIERRAFSWTTFLAQLEATLPDDVRVTSVQPIIDADEMRVSMVVEARSEEAVAAFMDALEAEGAFRRVLPLDVRRAFDDIVDATLVGIYERPAHTGAAALVDGAPGEEP